MTEPLGLLFDVVLRIGDQLQDNKILHFAPAAEKSTSARVIDQFPGTVFIRASLFCDSLNNVFR